MAIRIATELGAELAVVQIAGLVARRILCQLAPGQAIEAGERFGLIRFGSRTDLYMPASWSIQVIEGQYVRGGETVIADTQSDEPARIGVVR
jgi:phosphatidylserine decarboxylase